MRFSPAAITLSACLLVMSSVSLGKRADYDISELSVDLVKRGDTAVKSGDNEEAAGLYETALAVDPRNRNAYIALARLMNTQGLKGKAIRYYSEALEIDPNDLSSLSEQADVMVSKKALEAAKKNLARLRILCRSDCGRIDKLALSIDEADKQPALQASAVEIKPTAQENDDK